MNVSRGEAAPWLDDLKELVGVTCAGIPTTSWAQWQPGAAVAQRTVVELAAAASSSLAPVIVTRTAIRHDSGQR